MTMRVHFINNGDVEYDLNVYGWTVDENNNLIICLREDEDGITPHEVINAARWSRITFSD